MGHMPRRFFVFLVVLTIMMSTMVVASGILHEPLPEAAATAHAPVERAAVPPSRNSDRSRAQEETREESQEWEQAEDGDAPPTRAPRAAEQDPLRIPESEPPAPIREEIPGGVAEVEVPNGLSGEYLLHEGTQKAPEGGSTYTVSIEVEEGLPISAEEFSDLVMKTLNHKKSWAKDGAVTFGRTDSSPDIRIILASPDTVDRECAPLKTNGRWSCGTGGKAMINADRWINGADAFTEAGGDILTYRRYLVNHEIGHLIGHVHESCPAKGEPAPVMVQQSITLEGCVPNGWAHP